MAYVISPAATGLPGQATLRPLAAAGSVRPVPDQYALATDERTNKRTDRQNDIAIALSHRFVAGA